MQPALVGAFTPMRRRSWVPQLGASSRAITLAAAASRRADDRGAGIRGKIDLDGYVAREPFRLLVPPPARPAGVDAEQVDATMKNGLLHVTLPKVARAQTMGSFHMIERILVPLDGSAFAEAALPQAVALADAFAAEIVLLRVVGPAPGDAPRANFAWRLLRAEAEAYLEEIADRLGAGERDVRVQVTQGDPADEILEFSRIEQIDLIILSLHGHGRDTSCAGGGTAHRVRSAATVSLLVIRPEDSPDSSLPHRRIVVALDGSQRAEWALRLAVAVASISKAELHVVQVVQVPEMPRRVRPSDEDTRLRERVVEANRAAAEDYMGEIRRRLQSDARSIHFHVVTATGVANKLRDVLSDLGADLLVMSAHGYSGDSPWLFGGIVGSFLAHSPVPLLVFQDMAPDLEENTRGEQGRLAGSRVTA